MFIELPLLHIIYVQDWFSIGGCSRIIGEEGWKTSKDVRDVVPLSKLIRKSVCPDSL